MPQQQDTCLFVDNDCKKSVIRNFPPPTPADDEYLVQVLYSGINPADIKHASELGIRDVVMGYDFCGRVLGTPKSPPNGPGQAKFAAGQLVAGMTPSGIGRPHRYGTHRDQLACPEDLMFSVPESLPPQEAAALSVVTCTAADSLYCFFKAPSPDDKEQQGPNHGSLLVWGGSTGVGLCLIQLARVSRVSPIIVTASPARHELLRDLGATHCFDYRDPDVKSKIKEAVQGSQGGKLAFAIDAVGSNEAVGLIEQLKDQETVFLTTVFHPGKPGLKMPLACTRYDMALRLPNGMDITIPARVDDWKRSWNAVGWAVAHYGKGFRMPAVEVFDGKAEDALVELEKVAAQAKFGKLVIKHPLN
jgi:NADPH:quinone reductase-like Zn-dependent oxidoreductase